ncbi:MAG: MFS transporter [Rhodobacteraceae bacterium]|nr:MFS transporter [Paracoccaceae bacterium]
MTPVTKFTLMLVVFVDLIGQGLVFPIINGLIMEPTAGFLPEATSMNDRHFDYGLVIGMFFLAWFLGVVYIAKLSDAIGRKKALLICLGGALVGYALSIAALTMNSLWLLILGRAVTGFTAGNQPIAQAAMVDGSRNPAERDRNMGLILTGVSIGLVGGPIIGGILTDKNLIGPIASYSLPLYAALGLVALTMVLVIFFFHDMRTERRPFVFRPLDVIDSLWQVRNHPIVLRLMPVYIFFMIANVTFYVFVDNYLASAFGFGVMGGSAVMMVIGLAIAISGTLLIGPVQAHVAKRLIVLACLLIMVGCSLAFVSLQVAIATFVPVFFFYLFFGVAYPTIIGVFSGAVGADDQGWVMGVTIAVFCLAGGVMSLAGGGLMDVNIRLPFFIAAASATLAILLYLVSWRSPDIRQLTGRPGAS